jgi:hypothetical protein
MRICIYTRIEQKLFKNLKVAFIVEKKFAKNKEPSINAEKYNSAFITI